MYRFIIRKIPFLGDTYGGKKRGGRHGYDVEKKGTMCR